MNRPIYEYRTNIPIESEILSRAVCVDFDVQSALDFKRNTFPITTTILVT